MPAARFAALTAAILLMGPAVQAQTEAVGAVSDAPMRATQAPDGVRAAEHVRLTAKDAIAVAELHGSGTVLEAGLLMRGDEARYTIVALTKGGGVWRGSVDANSGCLIDQRIMPLHKAAAVDAIGPATAKLAQQARLPLAQAMQSAEAKAGGRVLDARLENADGRPTYEIQVARGDDVDDLVVNPSNGAVRLADD